MQLLAPGGATLIDVDLGQACLGEKVARMRLFFATGAAFLSARLLALCLSMSAVLNWTSVARNCSALYQGNGSLWLSASCNKR